MHDGAVAVDQRTHRHVFPQYIGDQSADAPLAGEYEHGVHHARPDTGALVLVDDRDRQLGRTGLTSHPARHADGAALGVAVVIAQRCVERDDGPVVGAVYVGQTFQHGFGQLVHWGEEAHVPRLGTQRVESLLEVPVEVGRDGFAGDDERGVVNVPMMPESGTLVVAIDGTCDDGRHTWSTVRWLV